VAVYALDVARLTAFYDAISDLDVVEVQDGFTVLQSATLELALVAIPPHVARTFTVADPPERREDAAIKLVLPVESLASARALAPSLGGIVDSVDSEWAWRGCAGCDGHDPEGNVVHLRETTPR
jgi:hypothetical protein